MAEEQVPPLTVDSFDGGLVDEYIGAQPNSWQKADNVIITPDKKFQNRPGSVVDFPGSTRSRVVASAGSRRIGLAIPTYGTILKQVVKTLQYDTGAAMAELKGPQTVPESAFAPVTNDETAFCYSSWNGHVYITHDALNQRPVKVYSTSSTSSGLKLRTAGLPKTATPVAANFVGESGSGSSYIYAFVYKYTYTVNGVTFVDRSAPVYVTRTASTPATSINLSAGGGRTDMTLTNASGEHYDVTSTSLVVEIYRTENNGIVFYKWSGSDPAATQNPTLGSVSASWAITNDTLYVTGGVVENDRPPICKYVHMTTGFGYYAHGIDVDTGETLKSTLWQSKQGDTDSVPADFNVELEEEIVGISSVRSIPVVFCKGAIYRIDGYYDLLGDGGMNPIKLSDSIGGINQLSIVQTLDWIYFAGSDGFYRTNGYEIQSISDNAKNRFTAQYKTFVGTDLKEKRIYGCLQKEEKRVLWAVESDSGEYEGDNNKIIPVDIRSGCATSWSSGWRDDDSENRYTSQFQNNFRPTALCVLDKDLYRCDLTGYTFKHQTSTLTDPKIDTTVSDTTLWSENPVIYDIRMASTDFGLANVRKWVESMTLKAKLVVDSNIAEPISFNTTLQIKSDNDNRQIPVNLVEVYERPLILWGDLDVEYGDPILWEAPSGLINVKRMFPASGGLRCSNKQIQFTNLFANVSNSDMRGTANISGNTVQMPQISVTGDVTNGSDEITNVSDTSSLVTGMGISGTGIPTDATITSIDGTTVTISDNATATNSTVTLTCAKLFPEDCVDYWVAFESDDYTKEHKITALSGTPNGSMITVSGSPAANPSGKWIMRGFFKGDGFSLIEYTLNFVPMSDSQKPFRGKSRVNA